MYRLVVAAMTRVWLTAGGSWEGSGTQYLMQQGHNNGTTTEARMGHGGHASAADLSDIVTNSIAGGPWSDSLSI